jgi:AAA domain
MLAEHGIGPLPQHGQLCRISLTVQADPERGGGTAGRGRVQGIRDGPGEFLEPGGQVQVAAEPGAVEALIEQHDLAAQGGDCTAGARVIATGDTAQLGAVEAGGMFRLLAQEVPAARLHEVRRFTAEWERQASLRLRDGDLAAVATYDRHGRIRGADAEAACDRAASMWLADHLRGKDVLLLAGSNAEAAELSRRGQARLTQMGSVGPPQAPLADSNHAGVGDLVRARLNTKIDADGRQLTNRDIFQVTAFHGADAEVRRQRPDGT